MALSIGTRRFACVSAAFATIITTAVLVLDISPASATTPAMPVFTTQPGAATPGAMTQPVDAEHDHSRADEWHRHLGSVTGTAVVKSSKLSLCSVKLAKSRRTCAFLSSLVGPAGIAWVRNAGSSTYAQTTSEVTVKLSKPHRR